ncbi:DNA double-strand break repair nuclease NurA [Rhodocaloribacter litoris]|uniref:DNA double-strand break repair nuclease NurA n=1 Tax=Rhodocaloribacter litoris TaxID=2558931 RepID=UPI00141F3478|nr:DNA double-strand break repair nuclease NurA [Rhodocaloribacter litoris]QXD14877.1 DNA double-strand break repair nuclease NurA [Rhodocaloribacter litoris]
MLDFHRLQSQLADFSAYQTREAALTASRLRRALAALEACRPAWEGLREKVAAARPKWLVAGLRADPGGVHHCGPRPTPVTVVATDGSQIFPDRHVEPTCYLLNVSRIAFQYGTRERPLMEAVPVFRYRRTELDALEDPLLDGATAEVVSALRDEIELRELLDTAKAARLPGRPLVALADGTLIRWMIRRMQNRALEAQLIERYTEILSGFRDEGLPLCSYISMPANTEVVNLLRLFLDEPEETGDGTTPPDPEQTLAGLTDRRLFEAVLPPGARSATFESASHIQREYGEDRICYFYLHVPLPGGGEIGRVEIPCWVADDERLVDLVHAVVLSECEKGNGYPMILSEAHERAVIRAQEKALFYELIEREMRGKGLSYAGSRKQASKRRPVV